MENANREDLVAATAHVLRAQVASEESKRARTIGEGFAGLARESAGGVCSGLSAAITGPVSGYRKAGRRGIFAGTAEGVNAGIEALNTGIGAGVTRLAESYTTRKSTLPSGRKGRGGKVDYRSDAPCSGIAGTEHDTIAQEISRIYEIEKQRIYGNVHETPPHEEDASDGSTVSSRTSMQELEHTELYNILGVRTNASPRDIRKAFVSRAQTCHPDKNLGDPTAQEKFVELTKAYKVLADTRQRELYDKTGGTASTFGVKNGSSSSDIAERGPGDVARAMGELDPLVVFEVLFGNSKLIHITGDLMKATLFTVKHGFLDTAYEGKRSKPIEESSNSEASQGPLNSFFSKDDGRDPFGGERALFQEERIAWLAKLLTMRIEPWLRGDEQGVAMHANHEVLVAREDIFGPEILRTVGTVWASVAKSKTSRSRKALRAALHKIDSHAERVVIRAEMEAANGRVRSGIPSEAENSGCEGPRGHALGKHREEMDENIVDSVRKLGRIWTAAKWDIQKTLREVARRVLTEEGVEADVVAMRASAIVAIASIFERA